MKARDIIRAVEAAGWVEARVTGGHKHFKHPTLPGLVTIPVHGGADVKIDVVKSIERQSGLNLRRES